MFVTSFPLPKVLTPGLTLGSNVFSGFKFSQLEMSASFIYPSHTLYSCRNSEAVLFHLVENFEFSPSGKEIFWENNVIANPTVKTGGKKYQLPIKVKLAK